eukprot:NODE_1052_length_1686_cov_24.311097_g988_i0.p1 GENE.NODE_1052_length_1686_cov_24.311097_g988_i0~~NODE_1052_length_1686_cov_24.311097_g988_i0.p1  ORF type:complete len:532 (-),score=135.64 NODE_1052_length_1686_cov_24.311097_g988_i0:89-1663(-)
MFDLSSDTFQTLWAQHPLPAQTFHYGTAGFRSPHGSLDGVAFRVGVLAALRAQHLATNVGVCVTASHNGHQDNGLKIIEGNGEMLEIDWEEHATTIANLRTPETLSTLLAAIWPTTYHPECSVIVGHDTRPSGPSLVQAILDGCRSVGQAALDLGLRTTPELHFAVRESNLPAAPPIQELPSLYYTRMLSAFRSLAPACGGLHVDCANGVGTGLLQRLEASVHCVPFNTNTADCLLLNHQCGADYVQKEQRCPANTPLPEPGARYASLDGDADRLVYFIPTDIPDACQLIDGDKILTLWCKFFQAQLACLALPLIIGVVQTAYANGASTQMLRGMGLQVEIVPTGVKHLHPRAKRFDIGVYFEANGHGTALFSHQFTSALAAYKPTSPEQATALARLQACQQLLHPTVGDAIADLLMCEACLAILQWDVEKFVSLYTDLPSRQLKVSFENHTRIKTVWDETKVTQPASMQAEIDKCVSMYEGARAFVRPSGTEPAVRIYAEASNQVEADALALDLKKMLEGVKL